MTTDLIMRVDVRTTTTHSRETSSVVTNYETEMHIENTHI